MDNALVRFIGLAPKDVIELICNYLEFSEFLSLTSVSRYVRSILVNHHPFWLNYYMKRVNFRHYEDDTPSTGKSYGKYQLRMPSFDKRHGNTDPANRLLNSARKVEIMNTDTALSTNPMLNLSILDNFKRSRWKGEFKQYTENLSKFTLPTMIVPTLGCNPFLVVSKNSVCGFNMNEGKFMFNNFMTPLNDHRRYEIKICCWVRLDDSSYTEESFRSLTSRVSRVPKILVIVYRTDINTLSVSFYCYDDPGFVNIPSMALKMTIDPSDEVSAIDVYASILSWDGRDMCFSYMNIFMGTNKGNVLQKRLEGERLVVERRKSVTSHEITRLRFVFCHNKALVVVFSSGNYLGVIDVSNDNWNVIEDINDSVVTFSIDAPNCLMAYSTSFQNRTIYVDLYNSNSKKSYYLVPKPPFRILSLERDSKWAIVIRNYIRVLQVIHPNIKPGDQNKVGSSKQYDDYSTDSSKDYSYNDYGPNAASETSIINGLDFSNLTNGVNGTNETAHSYEINATNSLGPSSVMNNLPADNEMPASGSVNGVVCNGAMNGVQGVGLNNGWHAVAGTNVIDALNGSCENEMALERLNLRGKSDKAEPNSHKLKFKSLCTLNGHFSDITHCANDGWSKLVTIDSSHNLFVWDYTIGCKIFSFSLLADMKRNVVPIPYADEFEGKVKKNSFKRVDSKCSIRSDSTDGYYNSSRKNSDNHHRKDQDACFKKDLDFRRSVKLMNRMVSNSEVKDAIEDFLYLDESDLDASPLSHNYKKTSQNSHRSKHTVPASNIKGLLDPNKKGQKYYVDVSVQSLIVYYKSFNVMQVWSFK